MLGHSRTQPGQTAHWSGRCEKHEPDITAWCEPKAAVMLCLDLCASYQHKLELPRLALHSDGEDEAGAQSVQYCMHSWHRPSMHSRSCCQGLWLSCRSLVQPRRSHRTRIRTSVCSAGPAQSPAAGARCRAAPALPETRCAYPLRLRGRPRCACCCRPAAAASAQQQSCVRSRSLAGSKSLRQTQQP